MRFLHIQLMQYKLDKKIFFFPNSTAMFIFELKKKRLVSDSIATGGYISEWSKLQPKENDGVE